MMKLDLQWAVREHGATGFEQVRSEGGQHGKGTSRGLTNELGHGVVLALCFDGTHDAVIFQDREEQLHKV